MKLLRVWLNVYINIQCLYDQSFTHCDLECSEVKISSGSRSPKWLRENTFTTFTIPAIKYPADYWVGNVNMIGYQLILLLSALQYSLDKVLLNNRLNVANRLTSLVPPLRWISCNKLQKKFQQIVPTVSTEAGFTWEIQILDSTDDITIIII